MLGSFVTKSQASAVGEPFVREVVVVGQSGTPESWADLMALIREDWERHRRDSSKPGFRAIAVYRLGRWQRYTQANRLWSRPARKAFALVVRFLSRFVRNHYGIELPVTASIGRRLHIPHHGAIVIHRRATIGPDCTIRQGVTIGSAANTRSERPPVIGASVNIGAGAMVLGEVTIGDNVRIGPNVVVLRSVPAGATVFAAPARVIHPPESAASTPTDEHSAGDSVTETVTGLPKAVPEG